VVYKPPSALQVSRYLAARSESQSLLVLALAVVLLVIL